MRHLIAILILAVPQTLFAQTLGSRQAARIQLNSISASIHENPTGLYVCLWHDWGGWSSSSHAVLWVRRRGWYGRRHAMTTRLADLRTLRQQNGARRPANQCEDSRSGDRPYNHGQPLHS